MFILHKLIKKLFVVIMLCLNITYIAIPSIQRFLNKGIFIEVSTETPESLVFPAVTIARIGQNGW